MCPRATPSGVRGAGIRGDRSQALGFKATAATRASHAVVRLMQDGDIQLAHGEH